MRKGQKVFITGTLVEQANGHWMIRLDGCEGQPSLVVLPESLLLTKKKAKEEIDVAGR